MPCHPLQRQIRVYKSVLGQTGTEAGLGKVRNRPCPVIRQPGRRPATTQVGGIDVSTHRGVAAGSYHTVDARAARGIVMETKDLLVGESVRVGNDGRAFVHHDNRRAMVVAVVVVPVQVHEPIAQQVRALASLFRASSTTAWPDPVGGASPVTVAS
jgi:hypothetical protein